MSASPARAAVPSSSRSRSTTPTQKPAMSNSSGSIRPGCSAVSPPISEQPASVQPSATEATNAATRSGKIRPTAT